MLNWAKHRFEARKAVGAVEAERRLFQIPDGERVYAIGDVHGRFDLLFRLLGTIREREAAIPTAKTTIVMIGDLIDRGPESAAVIELVCGWKQPWASMVALNGNHEAKLASLLEGQSVRLNDWLRMGGAATLRSYGVAEDVIQGAQPGVLLEAARSAIPMEHQRWLRSLPSHWRCGDYLFVHAGVKPGVALADQSNQDLMSIREEFLESKADHGSLVVHGHSVQQAVEHRSNRIGIDTGAWKTGKLTAVALERSDVRFVTHSGPAQAAGNIQGR